MFVTSLRKYCTKISFIFSILRMNKLMSEKFLKAFIVIIAVCCIYGIFSGMRIFWIEPVSQSVGRHTRNIIVASDYVNVLMVVRRLELVGTIAAVNSIIQNTQSPVHFNFVTDNETVNYLWLWIEKTSLKQISYEIKFVTKEWLQKKLGLTGNTMQLLPYSSIFYHNLFPHLRGNVVVLESDVIVQGDVVELKEMEFEQDFIAAFASNCDPIIQRFKFQQILYGDVVDINNSNIQDLHLNASACTFASGIFVLNVKSWNQENATKKVLDFIHLNQKRKFYEGEEPLTAMTLALHEKIMTLVPLWNVRNLGTSPSSRYPAKFLREAKLLRWSGPFKPWRKRRSPYQNLWKNYFIPDPTGQFTLVKHNMSRSR